MKVNCSDVRHISVDNGPWKINEIHNLSIINDPQKETINIPGTTYLTLSVPHYGHILQDIYSQYRMLQSYYKDLNIVLTNVSKKGMFYGMWQPKVINDFLDILNYKPSSIVDISQNNYFFNKIVFIFDMCNLLPEEFHLQYGTTHHHYLPFCTCYTGTHPCGESPYFNYWYQAIDILRQDFKPYFNWSLDKKFYVSRKEYNQQYKSQIESLEGKNLDKNQQQTLRRAKLRFSPQEEQIEQYFKQNSYTILEPQHLGLKEQISLFSQSKTIASISGTALINAYWCPPQTKIIELNIIPEYKYHYDVFAKYCGITDYIKINNPDSIFTFDVRGILDLPSVPA